MTQEPFDTDEMAKEFSINFAGQAFSGNQQLAFSINNKLLVLLVKDLEGIFTFLD